MDPKLGDIGFRKGAVRRTEEGLVERASTNLIIERKVIVDQEVWRIAYRTVKGAVKAAKLSTRFTFGIKVEEVKGQRAGDQLGASPASDC